MTNNQIQFARLKEEGRHNVVTEGETGRHNIVTENETQRHNVQQEAIGRSQAGASWAGVKETSRHNQAQEEIQKSQLAETIRHAGVTENLEGRKVTSQEILQEAQAYAAKLTAEANSRNAELRADELQEAIRSHLVNEGISQQQADAASKQATARMISSYTGIANAVTGGAKDLSQAGRNLTGIITDLGRTFTNEGG